MFHLRQYFISVPFLSPVRPLLFPSVSASKTLYKKLHTVATDLAVFSTRAAKKYDEYRY